MNRGLTIAGLLGLGAALGVGSALVMLNFGSTIGVESIDGWAGNHSTGARAADPYTRALVAKSGLLALTQAETIYFTRTTDETGAPLDAACVYQLDGGPLPSRWWSVTLYAADDFLPINGDQAQSADATRMAAVADPARPGAWSVRVAPEPAGAKTWISSQNAGKFTLTLRLYNPEPGARADFKSIRFPSLKTLSCQRSPA
jgi:hypothetical protein